MLNSIRTSVVALGLLPIFVFVGSDPSDDELAALFEAGFAKQVVPVPPAP